MILKLYMNIATTEALGPGKRFAIWVQGCNKRCKGCIAPDAWDINGGYEKDVSKLADEIIKTPDIEGITISGGEPFLQQEALCELIVRVRERKDIGVIIYTGMRYSEIETTTLARFADIIIDGEYVEGLNDNKSLRGSSNQRVIATSKRYADVIGSLYSQNGRKIEMIINENSLRMIGIPSKAVLDMVEGR